MENKTLRDRVPPFVPHEEWIVPSWMDVTFPTGLYQSQVYLEVIFYLIRVLFVVLRRGGSFLLFTRSSNRDDNEGSSNLVDDSGRQHH